MIPVLILDVMVILMLGVIAISNRLVSDFRYGGKWLNTGHNGSDC